MGEAVTVLSFFHEATSTASHLIVEPTSGEAAIVDPVLDYEPANGRTGTGFTDTMLAALAEAKGTLRWILETHPHADHLSSAQYIRGRTGAPVVIGAEVTHIQAFFKPKFNATDLVPDGSDFDRLVGDGERLPLGAQAIAVLHTPGHTRACVTYCIADAAFVGDTVFMPDYGTARTDFPTGDPHVLYRSIQRIHALPDATRLFMCHDYRGPGRTKTLMVATVAESKRNVHLREHPDEAGFVAYREAKNKTLGPPRLLAASVQVNIRAGKMPPPDQDGRTYLRIPVNGL
jgi:glyoxylase-like metal-dependent hydrolase (beta-lactamase superfamily II)